MKKNLIFYIPLILSLMPGFAITCGNFVLVYISLALLIFFAFFIFVYRKKFITKLFDIYKISTVKYFVFLYLWILFSSILAVFWGYHSISRVIIVAIIGLIFSYIQIMLYPIFIFNKYVSLKSFIKFLYFAFFVIFLIGIIEFFALSYKITFIKDILDFIAASGIYEKGVYLIEGRSSLPRVKSLFLEPSHFIVFIEINLPIIYSLSLSKISIFRNKYLNFILKKMMIPLTWICIILTQSPIGLVISLIITIIYFHKKIMNIFIRNYTIIIAIFTMLIIYLISSFHSFDISKSYLHRISVIIELFYKPSFDSFISIEPSLASRVIYYINQFTLFLKHPFIGIGFMNNGDLMINHIEQSRIPYSLELHNALESAYETRRITICTNAMYQLLSQTGLLGFLLYLNFMIRTIFSIKKYSKIYNGIEYIFFNSVKNSTLVILYISIFYNINFYMNTIISFYVGIACALTYIGNKKYRLIKSVKERNNYESNS